MDLVVIRKMKAEDIDDVCAVCMASFSDSVANTLSQEGILTFSKIAASDAFFNRMKEGNFILVAEKHHRIEGVIELKQGHHIAMFFVNPENQKKGIGRKLLASVLKFTDSKTITVSASLSSIFVYEKYGFKCNGDIDNLEGLIYQPMELNLTTLP